MAERRANKKAGGLPKLPISISKLNKISDRILMQGQSDASMRVLVDATADKALLEYAYERLYPATENVKCVVEVFTNERPRLASDADLNLLIAGQSEHNSMLISLAHEFELPLAVITADFEALLPGLDVATVSDVAADIITSPAGEELDEAMLEEFFAELGRWVAFNLPDVSVTLARAFPFMRRSIAADIIKNTAFQNSLVAAVFFMPGPDIATLTLNQAKMVIQIASLYNMELGTERLKEIAVLVAAAFGSRALARFLVGRLPLVAWAIRGGLGFSVTFGIGQAALKLYEQRGLEDAGVVAGEGGEAAGAPACRKDAGAGEGFSQ